MAKNKTQQKKPVVNTPSATAQSSRMKTRTEEDQPADYRQVLSNLTQLIGESRRRAAATVNRELVLLYWQIGAVIVHQQEQATWGDAVVEQLAKDLRAEFPDMKGLTRENLFRVRKFFTATCLVDEWLLRDDTKSEKVATAPPLFTGKSSHTEKVATSSPHSTEQADGPAGAGKLLPSNAFTTIQSQELTQLIPNVSRSHHKEIIGACDSPAEHFFYLAMSVRERWSVRELRRQIDSVLFSRYVSVRENPERCLPEAAESGDLLPFKDHYVLEFLGLEEEHSERELRHAILANLRDFFLEFGRDLSFVGEEYPLTIGNETFSIDLLFFHRRLQCLIAVELKKGKFKPEYVGKSCFYCAALDEQVRLAHENPTLGLVLCKSANSVQVRLALTAAADRIGVATYQTGLPDTDLIERRLSQFRLEGFPDKSETEE